MAKAAKRSVSLRMTGDGLDPVEVTRLLGRKPDLAAKLGETFYSPKGRPSTARTGFWHLHAADSSPCDFDAQIMALFAGLTQDLAVWADLASRFRLELFCGMIMQELNEGTGLEAATILAMAQRGLSFGLDVYGPLGPDDDA